MPDQETLAFFLGTVSLFLLLCLLYLGVQWRILCLLYGPPPPQEPVEEDMYNDPTEEVRVISCP